MSATAGASSARQWTVLNRQRTRKLDTRLFQRIAETLAAELLGLQEFSLGIVVTTAAEMIRLNETFLRHAGSTDVIAFDYREPSRTARRLSPDSAERQRQAGNRRDACRVLYGEIFICLDEAVAQARRFRTSWPSEITRCLIHAMLHLVGHSDREPAARRRMKREEDRLLRVLGRRYCLRRLAGQPRSPSSSLRRASSASKKPKRFHATMNG